MVLLGRKAIERGACGSTDGRRAGAGFRDDAVGTGNALMALNRPEEARVVYQRALELARTATGIQVSSISTLETKLTSK